MQSVMTRLVQLRDPAGERRVAVAEGNALRLLRTFTSTYDLARAAARGGSALASVAANDLGPDTLPYEEVHALRTEWKFLPAMDHPEEPARCLVSGTGLTHLASAQNRQAMHAAAGVDVTDSMRMYLVGC
jgi:hypothetical protein